MLSEVSIQDITERMNSYSEKISEHGRDDLELAQKELGAIQNKIYKLLRLVVETDVSPETIADELKHLNASKLYLERRVGELTVSNTAVSFTELITADLLNRSREIVRTRNLVECRNLIYAFVDSVIVYGDRVEVLFKVNVPDDEGFGLVPLRIEQSKEAITEGFRKVV